ncbi:MAG: hypothetical protein COB60_07310 [Flavobacteriaceae bacterium]|nr:MAG: hypothetical protein COB60_07310 [Flavobacteriaceae bacterium]
MKKLKYLSIVLAMTLAFTACNDAIEIDPKDEIVESNALTSVRDIEDAVIGVYAAISGSNLINWNSRFTDNTRKGVGNRGQGVQVHTWSINSSTGDAAAMWNNMYLVNNRLNRVLDVIDGIPTENDDDINLIKQLKGELLVIRAMSHFDLARYYSTSYTNESELSVPYIDYTVVLEKPSRNTMGEVYAFLDKDLNEASALLAGSSSSNIYITPDLIPALRARIALYKEDNVSAITNATIVINKFNLAPNGEFVDIWTDDIEDEVIFKLKRNPGEGAIGTLFTASNGDIFFSPSDEIVSLYSDSDIRKEVYFSSDFQEVVKYPGTSSNAGLNDIKLFRVSEQYLIRAEAYAKEGDLVKAAADYNKLREKRITSYVNESFANLTEALSKIALERRRELAFEGHHFFDLKRTGMDVDRWEVDAAPNPNSILLNAGDYRFTLPIPQAEIFANENMVQNSGYTSN